MKSIGHIADGAMKRFQRRVQKPDFSGSDTMWNGPADVFVVGETEYSGNIIYSNGNIDMVLFPGDYCTFSKAKSNEPTLE